MLPEQRKTPTLHLPLYQNMPHRKIAGTDFTVVTSYRAKDGSYGQYILFDADGVWLGRVTSHSARLALSKGYHEGHQAYSHRLRTFRNLAEAAAYFASQREA